MLPFRHTARLRLLCASLAGFAALCPAAGQAVPGRLGKILQARQRIAAQEKKRQPRWAAPLVTTSPRYAEGLRADFIRQSANRGQTNWNYGGSKGFQIIPYRRLEFRFTPPPFFTHSAINSRDGFGDVQMRLKTVLYVSTAEHHDAMIVFNLGATLPTGKNANGSPNTAVVPTLVAGKGFGRLAVLSSIGSNFPIAGTRDTGTPIVFNTAAEYRAKGLLWVQAEANATFFHGGRNDGRQQVFMTPGVIVNGFHLCHGTPENPCPTLSLGAGEQIAVSSFYNYNHALLFSGRLRF